MSRQFWLAPNSSSQQVLRSVLDNTMNKYFNQISVCKVLEYFHVGPFKLYIIFGAHFLPPAPLHWCDWFFQYYRFKTSVFQPFVYYGTLTGLFKQLAAPLSVEKTWNRSKNHVYVIIGGTPSTILRHPSVSRHPGWEPLP